MPQTIVKHESVLDAGSIGARVAKLYAEALYAAAEAQSAAITVGDELSLFAGQVVSSNATVESFLASPAVGKRAKMAALDAALPGNASDLLRGLLALLAQNGRLDLVRGISAAYQQILDERAGRVRVKVSSAIPLSDAQRESLTKMLADSLGKEPILDARVSPELLGGLVVQVGDRVVDTSVRTRLDSLRTLLLDKGSSYGVKN